MSEISDLIWFIAECAQYNIDKLKKRYPDGFSSKKSKGSLKAPFLLIKMRYTSQYFMIIYLLFIKTIL